MSHTLVVEGNTNRNIARWLKLSQHTVKSHVFGIFEKVGVSTRLELALYSVYSDRRAILKEMDLENQGDFLAELDERHRARSRRALD